MPAKSAAQKRLMDAAAHNPAFAKKVGIPLKVAKEFSQASKGQTFDKGTEMKTKKMMDGGAARAAARDMDRAAAIRNLVRAAGAARGARPAVPAMAPGIARPVGMKKGGATASKMGTVVSGGKRAHGEHTVQQKGHTKAKQVVMKKGGKC